MASINNAYLAAKAELTEMGKELVNLVDNREALRMMEALKWIEDKDFPRIIASQILRLSFEIRQRRDVIHNATVFVDAAAMMRILNELEGEVKMVDHPLFAIGSELNDKLAKDLKDLLTLPVLDDTLMYHRDIKRLADTYATIKKLVD